MTKTIRNWKTAGLTDDFIFNKVMLDEEICLEVIRRVLPDLDIQKIEIPNAQKEMKFAPDAKGIRFDIYTKDAHNNRYDVEMQMENKTNLIKRMRYYQAVNALDSYEKGKDYLKANDSYVIFFLLF
ncbi:Rpn family recombination-promoting nuclease/putative transposase [Limosilactobacillus sp. STM2_1]|uniref:Rpn family recombination-promoting nuclease/putative transposase n=1 Tax=Limosilactobacillus rudii TaxID=2759755 RepID=A0A7W3UMA6_9LACO|nr:Rpn family recombination-promoting nuclease/putative transposase [Limosilactobacillus rudii]MBB1078765.1 Rpn family recombination-promoting nuclease/putative transposase [Limosilactobacillus rudii]MBB1098197.1 Rpn family recombination-promoting nuclease/putative transposase [Limosilactobacillus rudii]MCD7135269.1 Rpn family recombination-promoting nuclease/putative transposase [Limosilactobacillus rudii]